MWFSPEVPKVTTDSKRIHGVNEEMKGFALWFHKNQVGRWRIFSHFDKGNNKIEDGKILPENSCSLVLDPTKQRVKIRFQKIGTKITVLLTDDNVNSENWRTCIDYSVEGINYQGYIGFTSGNYGVIKNDIEFYKLIAYDYDPTSPYVRFKDSTAEVRYFSLHDEAEKEEVKSTDKAKDVLHMEKTKDQFSETGKGIMFTNKDTQEEAFFKLWETVHQYNIVMGEMIKTIKDTSEADPNLVKPNMLEDLKFTEDTIEYIGQNVHQMNSTLNYLGSGKYKQPDYDPDKIKLPEETAFGKFLLFKLYRRVKNPFAKLGEEF